MNAGFELICTIFTAREMFGDGDETYGYYQRALLLHLMFHNQLARQRLGKFTRGDRSNGYIEIAEPLVQAAAQAKIMYTKRACTPEAPFGMKFDITDLLKRTIAINAQD
jgi:hypothetical protein